MLHARRLRDLRTSEKFASNGIRNEESIKRTHAIDSLKAKIAYEQCSFMFTENKMIKLNEKSFKRNDIYHGKIYPISLISVKKIKRTILYNSII